MTPVPPFLVIPHPLSPDVFTGARERGQLGHWEDYVSGAQVYRTVPDTERPSADISPYNELLLFLFGK